MKNLFLKKVLYLYIIFGLITAFITYPFNSCNAGERKQVVLKGNAAQVAVDTGGGSIVDFHLLDMPLNPLTWDSETKENFKPRPMGHFLCFDRWGQPSENEGKNGMPFHGEATSVEWEILNPPKKTEGSVNAVMQCTLPMGGMKLKRTLSLYDNAPVLSVHEEITNINKIGRIYNIVQHSTIAPPFLDESVLVDTNAFKGYMQESPMPTPEEPVIYWPAIAYKGKLVDLRRLSDDPKPTVVSFVFRDENKIGWVTASNPQKGLLIGYIFDTGEYPWMNIWRDVKNGKPSARGMEFGTTGLHQPFAMMVKKHSMFGRTLFEYCDTGETINKSYIAFLAKIPADFQGVEDIFSSAGKIEITEKGSGKKISINY